MMVNSLLSKLISQRLNFFFCNEAYTMLIYRTSMGSRPPFGSPNLLQHLVEEYRKALQQTSMSTKLYVVIQPILVYTGLIEQLQHFFELEDMTSSVNLQEAFDVIGVARVKLFGGGMKTRGYGKQQQVVELYAYVGVELSRVVWLGWELGEE
ncbi:E3 ubiquitin-protein ligase UBR4 [Dendrobium catenatum]|uniref:E3 ubiquitin-protein ligase UBR4 n=1 Tax=Dendrobium catenatum TaxID=906689 RepID=A0A2I0VRU1_9ASPA|nr:E3 ubiquitin-protein ligase UBR4 [Dendrobium catenatum]